MVCIHTCSHVSFQKVIRILMLSFSLRFEVAVEQQVFSMGPMIQMHQMLTLHA